MKRNSFLFIILFFILVGVRSGISAFANELENSGFESITEAPWHWWGSAGSGTYGVKDFKYQGERSLEIIADGDNNSVLGFLQDLECEPDEEVTASVWLMSPEETPLTNSNAFVKLEFWPDEGYDPIKTKESKHLTGASDWTKAEVSDVAPDGTAKVKIGLFIWNPGANHSGRVYFDEASLTRKLVVAKPFVPVSEISINCGGPAYTDKNGKVYEADRKYSKRKGAGYLTGKAAKTGATISNTEDQVLYQSERWGTSGYRFDVPNGTYKIKQHFAETFHNEPGKRIFSVYIQGKKVISDLDIFREVGSNKALDYEFPTLVTNGRLDITAVAKVDAAKFSAISVTPLKNDNTAPVAVLGATAFGLDKEIALFWNGNKEADLLGYGVYRREASAKDFIRLNATPLSKAKYIDKTITAGKEYRYYVRAIDIFGNTSPPSKEISATAKQRDFFAIPRCAWQRILGDIPMDCASSSPDRGVALGGFGAGNFMYSLSGAFGPWALEVTEYDPLWLPEAAFHIYEKPKGGPVKVKSLSTSSAIKPAWDKLKVGEAKYYAFQPKGWTTYYDFAADISSEFFSPIIAQNYKETSYPTAVWQWRLHNPTSQKIDAAVMLTWPQPPFMKQVRQGFQNFLKEKDGVIGVVLKASDTNNTPETQNSEWCIATKKEKGITVSYAISWNKEGDGLDIWNDFKDDGILRNEKLDSSNSAAAVAIKVSLKPNETKIIPIALSWDYPIVKFKNITGDGTEWWKKYTEYFSRDSDNSFGIASETLARYTEWERQIDAWMNPVLNSLLYPDWLKTAAFNELYYTQFGGSFWEAGIKSGHEGKEFGNLHPEDNKFFVMESRTYLWAGTFDVRHYNSIVYTKFWPKIEKETLKVVADAIMYFDPQHQTPHDFGASWNDPFFSFDDYNTRYSHWKDLSSKFIQQVWRYYYFYKDKEFLDYVWPACKATYHYMKTTDSDKDFLPNNSGSDNTYDSFGLYGTSLLCGGLWVGALEAMEQMAIIEKDPILPEVKNWLISAKKNLDSQLWNQSGGYYNMDTEGKYTTAIMSDGLNGQRYCESFGLGDILPREKMKSHLEKVYQRCVVPLTDFTGDGIGDVGAMNALKDDGSYLGLGQSDEVWTGTSYFLAASMYKAGLKEEALKTAFGVYYTTYENEDSAYWFNTPEAWNVQGLNPRPNNPEQYQRPRAVWELIFEIGDPYQKK